MMLSGSVNAAVMMAHAQQPEIVNQSMPIANTTQVKGVLKCHGNIDMLADSQVNIAGCIIRGWSMKYMSIKSFFEKYRLSPSNKITAIIYNNHENEFEIYYE